MSVKKSCSFDGPQDINENRDEQSKTISYSSTSTFKKESCQNIVVYQ